MSHKYSVGQYVYYKPPIKHSAARGTYKIVSTLPVEIEGRNTYRIRSVIETFERTAEESELWLSRSGDSESRHRSLQ